MEGKEVLAGSRGRVGGTGEGRSLDLSSFADSAISNLGDLGQITQGCTLLTCKVIRLGVKCRLSDLEITEEKTETQRG